MKTLILTEKPSVAREFASTLAPGYKTENGYIELDRFIITWAIGHLLTPYDPDDYDVSLKKWNAETLPILPSPFKYKSIRESKKQLDTIKKIFKRNDIDRLIVATDAGREGELIARLILHEARSKLPALRFFTSDALTKEVIVKELKNARPLKDYDRLFIAGRARQIADWLVGMNLSRIVSIKMGDLFSVGRVQTAVLDLLVERRIEIDQFVPEDYFELKAKFKFQRDFLETYWFDPKLKTDEKRKLNKAEFVKITEKIAGKEGIVLKREEVERTLYSEGLFSLTDLQRAANSEYGFSASKTLDIAQSLYEKYKVLSYPRTDSKVMGTSSLDLIKEKVFFFKEIYPEYFDKFSPQKLSLKNKIVFDDSKLTDHHGLIPLKEFKGNPESPEGRIYYLVLKRFISNFLENHRYQDVEFEIECVGEFFKARARKILEIGFKILDEKIKDDVIKDVNLMDRGFHVQSEIEEKKTRPPFEYTESSLLYDMTNPARLVKESEFKKIFRTEVGLGTQATRANIIETLLKRLYVERKGKNLIVLPKGVELIKMLKTNQVSSQIASVRATAHWEIALQEMAQGEKGDESFIQEISIFVSMAVDEWKKLPSLERKNRNSFKRSESNFRTQKTNKSVLKKNVESIGACPICSKKIINFPKSYSCEGWKEGCSFTIWKSIAGVSISENDAKSIVNKKESRLISSFKSKSGRPFSAYLVVGQDGKITFKFENQFNQSIPKNNLKKETGNRLEELEL